MPKVKYRFLLIFILLFNTTMLFSASIYEQNQSSVYANQIARNKGDILTIIIDESTIASQKANTDLNKTSQIQGSMALTWKQAASFMGQNDSASKEAGDLIKGSNKFNGKGETARSSKINAKISVVVYDVYENGNLLIKGDQILNINGDEQKLQITGIIRNSDINKENYILSSQIANAQITLQGKGKVGQEQEKGFITSILGWIF